MKAGLNQSHFCCIRRLRFFTTPAIALLSETHHVKRNSRFDEENEPGLPAKSASITVVKGYQKYSLQVP